jgi:transposase-like protein
MLPEAVWQRCYVHFLRNALDYLPRKDDDCLDKFVQHYRLQELVLELATISIRVPLRSLAPL